MAPVAIWTQAVAAPAAPAICGRAASLPASGRDQPEGEIASDQKRYDRSERHPCPSNRSRTITNAIVMLGADTGALHDAPCQQRWQRPCKRAADAGDRE